jgi:hypothetical protein
VAVGPGAARWISRDGDSLMLQGAQREPLLLSHAQKGDEAQVAFSPSGDRLLVRTSDSLCKWTIGEDGTLDLDGCRWSTGGWASDAAWAAADKADETVVVFDRTAEGAALRPFFGHRETEEPRETGGDLACTSLPGRDDSPVAVLQHWEERLGHRFRDQATPPEDTLETLSSEIVPVNPPAP